MVLSGLIWISSSLGGPGSLERSDFRVSPLRGFSGVERTHSQHFPSLEDMMVLKGLILSLFTLIGCGGLERTVFDSFPLGDCCVLEITEFFLIFIWEMWCVERIDFR